MSSQTDNDSGSTGITGNINRNGYILASLTLNGINRVGYGAIAIRNVNHTCNGINLKECAVGINYLVHIQRDREFVACLCILRNLEVNGEHHCAVSSSLLLALAGREYPVEILRIPNYITGVCIAVSLAGVGQSVIRLKTDYDTGCTGIAAYIYRNGNGFTRICRNLANFIRSISSGSNQHRSCCRLCKTGCSQCK